MVYFNEFFFKENGRSYESQGLSLDKLLHNMKILVDDQLTVTGALIFAREPRYLLPIFHVKAGVFPTNSITSNSYIDSREITGRFEVVFDRTVDFINSFMRHLQEDQDVNSLGRPEIPLEAIRELVMNAMIHRDYFISDAIKVFIFPDTIEIISPGHLPNHLTIENIKTGISNARNDLLASYAYRILPYRGYGRGIKKALELYPDIDFIDNRDGNVFKVIIKRRNNVYV
jgi:ATP-dependent DNA helicase RecG